MPENTVENTMEQPSNVVYIDKVTIIVRIAVILVGLILAHSVSQRVEY